LTAVVCALLLSTSARAADQGITGKKLLLKGPAKFVLLSKDPGISIAGSDPVGGADSSISFDDGSGPVTFSLPNTLWSTNGSGTLFKYKNAAAPGGTSAVKIAKVKSGLLKVVGKGLPFGVPAGTASINVVLSLDGETNTYCMTFAGTGDGSKFLVKDAAAGTCPPPPTPTATPTPTGCTTTHLLISEIRSRGLGGAADEFVELYNPTGVPVVLDNTWKLEARSNAATTYTTRWTGTGATVPAHGHFLIAGTAYTQMPAADDALSTGITDASSVRLSQSSAIVDAVCYAYDAASAQPFTTDATYTCEGPPLNNPHNNSTSTDTDASLERKPGGTAGNCTDTDVNASDFIVTTPANPQDTSSPPAP
jgi:hypothetical protein